MLLTAGPASADAGPQTLESSPLYDPSLSEDFLRTPPHRGGRPGLRVKHYDETRGLLAGFVGAGGKRILFRAKLLSNGAVLAAVFHWDDSTQSVKPLMAPAWDDASDPDKRTITMRMDGVDVRNVLRGKSTGQPAGPGERQLKDFLRGETGRVVSDGVMALYVLLEPIEPSPSLARLKMPFGAMRMAAELATGHYAGFDDADDVLGEEHAKGLREACAGKCLYRTRQFMIQPSGLFDMLSTHGAPIKTQGSAAAQCPAPSARTGFSLVTGSTEASESAPGSNCHGCCGPSCWGCTGIWTDECWGHDDCVDADGHLACIFTASVGNSLVEAVGSLLAAIGGSIVDALAGLFGYGTGGGCGSYIVCDDWDDWGKDFWGN